MEENFLEFSQSNVKQEPPVEFVLILPRPTSNWLSIKQEDVKRKWMKSVELMKFDTKWRRKSTLFQTFFTCPHCQLVVKTRRHLKACNKMKSAGFECDVCGKRFQEKWLLRPHMLKHSSDGKFRCDKCNHGFKSKHSLLLHSTSKNTHKCKTCAIKFSCALLLKLHRSEFHRNLFECDKCSYQTKVEGYLTRHKRSHDKSIQCETCQKNFATKHSLRLHQMQHKHGINATAPEETFDCGKCGKSFSSSTYLYIHQRQVHDEEQVKCKVCGKIYKNRTSLRLHRQTHFLCVVECPICNKMISKPVMAIHLRLHSAESLFKCDLCDFSTKTKKNLKVHIERMHLLMKLLNDSKCRDDFRDLELLDKLQHKHGSSATICEKNFKCDKCDKFFVTLKSLKEHNKNVHSEETFKCEICKKKFKTKNSLRAHNSGVHLKVSCSICHRKIGKNQMKSHMKVHQFGKRFQCDLCSCKTQFKQPLKEHINKMHRTDYLTCNFGCLKKFASFHQLFDHQKMHIGKDKWKCLTCDYQSNRKRYLLKHMTTKKHKSLNTK